MRENPFEIYRRIETSLSPLMRKCLRVHLPKIDSKNWWDTCVLSALTKIQRDNIRKEQTLEQFDLPALVTIFYYNRRNLKPILGVGDELTNYLFTIKTFRNDVIHKPDLILDEARLQVIEQSARLAEQILSSGIGQSSNRSNSEHKRFGLIVLVLLVIGGIGGYFYHQSSQESATRLECAKLKAELAAADHYRTVIDTYAAFKGIREAFATQCSTVKNIESVILSTDELYSISYSVQERVRNYILNLPKPQITPIANDEHWLRLAYSVLLKQKKISQGSYQEKREEIIKYVKELQLQHSLKPTGIPDVHLLNLIEHGHSGKEKD